jgi:hypothetical protein
MNSATPDEAFTRQLAVGSHVEGMDRLASAPAAVRRRHSASTRWTASAPTDVDRGKP